MTLAELDRYFKAKKNAIEREEKKQASYDYILADLIGRSIARIYNSSNKMPSIEDVYPSLFSKDEIQKSKVQRNKERFAAALQQFANTHNKNIEEVAKIK